MGGRRVTTRYTNSDVFEFPSVAYEVRERVAQELGFNGAALPYFKDGMVASYALPGDDCYEHLDPRWHNGLFTVHCNVIVLSPEQGGELLACGKTYEMPQGKFICYPVSELAHATSLIVGNKPRLMWVFGFCVTPQAFDKAARTYQ